MAPAKFEPLQNIPYRSEAELVTRSGNFFDMMKKRRSIRHFSDKAVPRCVIEKAIMTAGRAPSGANKQPWHFVAISDPILKKSLRHAAEQEEQAFYGGKAGESWLKDLQQFGTNAQKPFLETAPWLIVVFKELYGLGDQGNRSTNYYLNESVGLASGFLLAALHYAGLATLTHTPSPMGFLNKICQRPKNEKPVMVIVTGYPADQAQVPVIDKKPLEQITTFLDTAQAR